MATRNFLERPLKDENKWWTYLLVFVQSIFAALLFTGIVALIPLLLQLIFDRENVGDYHPGLLMGYLSFFLLLFWFFAGLYTGILLNRTLAETINGTKSVRWGRILFAFAVAFVWMAIDWGIDYFWHPDKYVFNADWHLWSALSLVLFGVLLLTTVVLLLYGYLTQEIGARTHSRQWAWIVPAIIFTLIIQSSDFGEPDFWLSTGETLTLFLLLGLIAILDDGIELAIGFIVGYGLFSLLFTISMFESPESLPESQMNSLFITNATEEPLRDLISVVVGGLIAFFIFYKKYRWDFKIMNERVERLPDDAPFRT
ncbi:MAG: hypothetical protein LBE91_12715 [Tannerella sp.]|jgi:MFS family permease|nr:hypothetical protein [Tannerella sp.]